MTLPSRDWPLDQEPAHPQAPIHPSHHQEAHQQREHPLHLQGKILPSHQRHLSLLPSRTAWRSIMMQPESITLGTKVRVHIPVYKTYTDERTNRTRRKFIRSERARGVVLEERTDSYGNKSYRIGVQNGNLDFWKNEHGEVWIRSQNLTPYVERTRTKPSTVARRRTNRSEWRAARQEAVAAGRHTFD